jgi:hypothetical protein
MFCTDESAANDIDSNVENEEDRASLRINLQIQRHWAEMTMLCKGLQGMGIENVALVASLEVCQSKH